MYIIEQEKEIIINLDNIIAIAIGNEMTSKNIYANSNNGEAAIMGEYKSTERAKEVLKEIQQAILEDKKVFEMPKE